MTRIAYVYIQHKHLLKQEVLDLIKAQLLNRSGDLDTMRSQSGELCDPFWVGERYLLTVVEALDDAGLTIGTDYRIYQMQIDPEKGGFGPLEDHWVMTTKLEERAGVRPAT